MCRPLPSMQFHFICETNGAGHNVNTNYEPPLYAAWDGKQTLFSTTEPKFIPYVGFDIQPLLWRNENIYNLEYGQYKQVTLHKP